MRKKESFGMGRIFVLVWILLNVLLALPIIVEGDTVEDIYKYEYNDGKNTIEITYKKTLELPNAPMGNKDVVNGATFYTKIGKESDNIQTPINIANKGNNWWYLSGAEWVEYIRSPKVTPLSFTSNNAVSSPPPPKKAQQKPPPEQDTKVFAEYLRDVEGIPPSEILKILNDPEEIKRFQGVGKLGLAKEDQIGKIGPKTANAANEAIKNHKQTSQLAEPFPPPQCFLPETPITLADGTEKQIKDIKEGDEILSYDMENKKSVPAKVTDVYSHETNDYLIINGKIKVTPYHWVYAKRR